jgi:membrane-associated phospholipid phosphatase
MTDFWNQRSARFCFVLQLAMLAAMLAGLSRASFRVDTAQLQHIFYTLGLGLFLVALNAFPVIRFRGNTDRAARVFTAVCGRLLDVSAIIIFAAFYAGCAGLASYLAMGIGMPMQDALYAHMDQALGFDWHGFIGFVNARPWLCDVLVWCYGHWASQIIVLISLFIIQVRQHELWDFVAILMLGAIFAVVFCGLMPAVAPYTYYAPEAALFNVLAQKEHAVGTVFIHDLMAVYTGTLDVFDLSKVKGIVTFPSFHAILAMAVVYATRNDRLLFWPALAFNSIVVISVVPVGGHYFVDIIGAAIALAISIAIVDWVNGRASLITRFNRALALAQMTLAQMKRAHMNSPGRPASATDSRISA